MPYLGYLGYKLAWCPADIRSLKVAHAVHTFLTFLLRLTHGPELPRLFVRESCGEMRNHQSELHSSHDVPF